MVLHVWASGMAKILQMHAVRLLEYQLRYGKFKMKPVKPC